MTSTIKSQITSDRLWRRSESRQVRPFAFVGSYLRTAAIQTTSQGNFTSEDRVSLEGIDRSRMSISLQIPRPPEMFADLVDIAIEDLDLVVLVEDTFFKSTSEAFRSPLGALKSDMISLPEGSYSEASWSTTVRIHTAVVLCRDLPQKAGRAWRRGSWLARKTFEIGLPPNVAMFRLRPASNDFFTSLGLPATTGYHVMLQGASLNSLEEDAADLVHVYVSDAMLEALSANDGSAATRAMVASMYADIVATVLTAGITEPESDPVEGSLTGTILSGLEEDLAIPRAQLVEFAAEDAGTRLRSVVQAQVQLRQEFMAAARRRS